MQTDLVRSGKLDACLQVIQYADDIDGDYGEAYDDGDDDFKAPGTSAAARKRLEPML